MQTWKMPLEPLKLFLDITGIHGRKAFCVSNPQCQLGEGYTWSALVGP